MHNLDGLEQVDYTAITPVNLGQCLPREVVATQVVHVPDQVFTSVTVGFLWVRFFLFLVDTGK